MNIRTIAFAFLGLSVIAIGQTTTGPLTVQGTLTATTLIQGSLGVCTIAGDIGGTSASPKVTGIQGVAVSATTPSLDYVLMYNGSQWAPAVNTPTFGSQTANTVLAAPNGSSGTPTFRALVGADLPTPTATTLGGIESIAASSHEWINSISTAGVPALSQPAASDLSNGTTGTGSVVLASSPTLVSPALGTPSSINLTNASSLPCSATPALTGDATTSAGSCATTVVKVNGGSLPASATVVGTNGSNQIVSASTTGGGNVVLASSPSLSSPSISAPTFSGSYDLAPVYVAPAVNTVSFSATPAFSGTLGNTQKIILTGNVTSSTVTGIPAGQMFFFIIEENATGGYTFVWPTNVKGGASISTAANAVNTQAFISDGTNLYALAPGAIN